MLATFPRRRAPGGWPLLATLVAHLLLAWSWRIAHPPAPPAERGEQVFDLILVPPPVLVKPQSRPPAPLPRSVPARAPLSLVPEPEPVTPPPPAPAPVADPFAIATPVAPAESALEAMVGRARRDALVIDREMRKGKSGVPEVADTPMGRFRAALESAHQDRGRGVTSDSYVAPDGQVIYRFRQAGKVWCRTGGSVAPKIGGAEGGGATPFDTRGGGGNAGSIPCPSHGAWR